MNEKQQLYLVIGVFVLLGAGELAYGYFGYQERGQHMAALETLDTNDRDAKAKLAKVGDLRETAKEMAAILEEYVTILPTEDEARAEAFLVHIDNFSRNSGLEMLKGAAEQTPESRGSRRGKGKQDEKKFVLHRYRFSLRGSFPSFLKFMNRVENHPRYLRIDSFDVRPFGAADRDDGIDELVLAEDPRKEIEVVISTYTYSKPTIGKAEDK